MEEPQPQQTLLTCLREGLVAADVIDPMTKDDEQKKMNLFLDHPLELPSKLRTVISEMSSEEPSLFLDELYKATKALFFGLPYNRDNDEIEIENQANRLHPAEEVQSPQEQQSLPPFHWWHGLDSNVDAEDQVEAIIRLFPSILREKQKVSPLSSLNNTYPIYSLLFCSKALVFIPLFAELGAELKTFPIRERAGLFCFMRNVIVHLVYNNLLKDKTTGKDYKKLDATCTQILRRLKNKGLIVCSDIYDLDLLPMILRTSMLSPVMQSDERLEFLVEWDPTVLMACGRGKSLLGVHLDALHDFFVRGYPSPRRSVQPRDFQRFHLLVKLSMSYFPESLGFVFHHNSLSIACEIFGAQQVTKVIDDELGRILLNRSNNYRTSNNDRLRTLVVCACTSEDISLDGLYTLFRRDPIALFPMPNPTENAV